MNNYIYKNTVIILMSLLAGFISVMTGCAEKEASRLEQIWNAGKIVNKVLRIKRWAGSPSAFEQYVVTIIFPSILIFFNQTVFVVYLMYLVIVFFSLFYIKRISDLLSNYI